MSSNVVRLKEHAFALGETPKPPPQACRAEDYLGPAEVDRVEGYEVFVRLPVGGPPLRAELALAFPYEPAVGDSLLVIARGDALYVIGVLRGTGRSVFSLPGDVGLHAGGELHLSGDKGVRVTGPA